MFRFLIILFFFSCNNIHLNNSFIEKSFLKNNNSFIYLNKNKNYIISDSLIIPYKHKIVFNNKSKIIIKKNGIIINKGELFFGEKNNDSLIFNYKNELDILKKYNTTIYSKKSKNYKIINNGFLFINDCLIVDLNIKSDSVLKLNNSIINNCSIFNNNYIKINNCFLNTCFLNINNNNIDLKNSIINKTSIELKNLKLFNTNNCLFYNNSNLNLNGCINNNIINSVFFKNKKSIYIDINNNYLKLFNNIFINNDNVIINKDSCQLYILNNTFNNNKLTIYSDYNNIISKNNIYSNNLIDFDLNQLKINHSFCLSNIDSLSGYFNLYSEPYYIDPINFNFNLKNNSPALRHGNNNLNIGANMNNIYYIKYLK